MMKTSALDGTARRLLGATVLLLFVSSGSVAWAQNAELLRKAQGGDASSQMLLAILYNDGLGDVAQDDVEAVKWYRKAAEQGNVSAQWMLGRMYAKGEGVVENDAEAVKWYRKAAEQGLEIAQFNLARTYDTGQGVAEDDAEAVKWYRKAAEQGNVSAQWMLGHFYRDGEGVVQNYVFAHMWANLARAQGNEYAGEDIEYLVTVMTKEQIAEAQKMASEWQAKHQGVGQ